ncbi:hypothetical protein [Polyangium sp. 15x6]|uniref:hypothetical protein n=1 Tax=Polyangium sp. 15x6 TaxID=3042687 RepID=UPI00249BD444|nr:hypothetical protein [Polyangium sp. 15x6]MDI3288058.1 hypothetical protein [Polyangium sp. 15x6]
MAKLNGRILWVGHDDPSPVRGAIVSEDKIAFDASSGEYDYTVTLTPVQNSPSMWKGRWKCALPREDGHVDARLYKCVDGGVVLVGNWREDNTDHWWFMELRP